MTSDLVPPIEGAPVQPLGVSGGQLYLLDALGQFRQVSARDADAGRAIADLFLGGSVGGLDPRDWLREFFPPKREAKAAADDRAWSRQDAGGWLIRACQSCGLFDPQVELRRIGVWRDGALAVAHCGRELLDATGARSPSGVLRAEAVYPAAPGQAFERALQSAEPVTVSDVFELHGEVAVGWAWSREIDATAWIGWLAAAALGSFPRWRPHLWVSGRKGSGKSELIQLACSVLGPMSGRVHNDYTPAGVRQLANGQARPLLFDEGEPDRVVGGVAGLVELARTMSGGDGSVAIRGGSDHTSVAFALAGSVYVSSIISAHLEPQDRSRFVMLQLLARPPSVDPAGDARRLEALHERGRELGLGFWRRMLSRSAEWDVALRASSAFVQRLGGEARDGDTIGAILAGWHLATSDSPIDDEALEALRDVALGLLDDSKAAQEEGEGERCLAALFDYVAPMGGGESWRVADLIWRASREGGEHTESARKRLVRVGLRYAVPDPHDSSKDRLLIAAGAHRALDDVFRGTRWIRGGHGQALRMLEGVEVVPNPQWLGSRKVRVLSLPRRLWPDYAEEVLEWVR